MKHYSRKDFVITETNERGEYGYCRICKADMQCFKSDGMLRHYNSHRTYKRLNLHINVSQLPKISELKPSIPKYRQTTNDILAKILGK